VVAAKSLQFEVRLTYVILASPEQNIERVKLRVAKGGHNVASDKIIARYARSLDQLPWFLDQADQASIFDNSGASPRLICLKKDRTITLDPEALPQIMEAVRKITTQ
jgi:predicted ABC-type ATPase